MGLPWPTNATGILVGADMVCSREVSTAANAQVKSRPAVNARFSTSMLYICIIIQTHGEYVARISAIISEGEQVR